jgi:hypothetical protein
LTLFVDKEKGKVVETHPTRADDSMHKLENQTNVLSAIVCYRVFFGNDGVFHREGKVIMNPNAKNPLTNDAILKIEKAIFR